VGDGKGEQFNKNWDFAHHFYLYDLYRFKKSYNRHFTGFGNGETGWLDHCPFGRHCHISMDLMDSLYTKKIPDETVENLAD
jgi:hypothetical protein